LPGFPICLKVAGVRAIVQQASHDRKTCTAKTGNDLIVVFCVTDAAELRPGDELDIPLPDVLRTGLIHRVPQGTTIAVVLQRSDIHDLRTGIGGHGRPSNISDARMLAK
jgi:hypothetical protein